MDRNDLINIIRKADREMIAEAGFRLAGKPKGTKNKKIDYVEIEADKMAEVELPKNVINKIDPKPKREMSDAQKANLEKGRQALLAKWEKLKTERETNKGKPKEQEAVIRVKSLVKDPNAKTILVKVNGKPGVRKVKSEMPKFEKVESKRVQKEESEDEEEEEEEVEQTEDYTEDTTESEMSDAPKSIRKINKRVKALKKVEQKLQAVTKNTVNPVNPYAQFLKW